jgi:group I intron endonuclease
MTGIYCIENKVNGKLYVGSSLDIEKRFRKHLADLKECKHHSRHLQRAWNEYTPVTFDFVILELSTREDLLQREQYWLTLLQSADSKFGYNISPTAGSPLGSKHSELAKQQKSERMRGHKKSSLYVENMSKTRVGEGNPAKKLSWRDAQDIRESKKTGIRSAVLAAKYHVDVKTINNIVAFRTWNSEPESWKYE